MSIRYITFLILHCFLLAETKPLALRPFIENPENYNYNRGIFLIIVGNSNGLENLQAGFGLKYLKYKKSQGFTIKVVLKEEIPFSGSILSGDDIRYYLQDYYNSNPMLEYVLLVGDNTFSLNSEDNIDLYDRLNSNGSNLIWIKIFGGL